MSWEQDEDRKPRVGFIGLGTMGGPMALNLQRSGYGLTVHDVRKEVAEAVLDGGAAWADSPADVGRASDITFVSLPGPQEVQAVLTGHGGVLAGSKRGSAVVDLSTNSPTVVRSLAVTAASHGIGFLAAPVSGGAAGASRGTLTIMVGGDVALFESTRPLLEAIGSQIFHVGDVGTGNVVKLVNNLLAINNMLSTVEALVLAGKAGVDLGRLVEVVSSGSGRSAMWEYGSRVVLQDRLRPSFTVSLAAKDLSLAVQMAEELGVPPSMAAHGRRLLAEYEDAGLGSDDVFATVKRLEEQAGVVVRGAIPAPERRER